MNHYFIYSNHENTIINLLAEEVYEKTITLTINV